MVSGVQRRESTDSTIEQEIERLRSAKVVALQRRYRELFGEQSPSSNRAHLFRRVAWRLQARALGDLSERARERAAQLADDTGLRQLAPRSFWQRFEAAKRDTPPRLPAPGTLLTRVYRERTVEVKVLETGFDYNARRTPL